MKKKLIEIWKKRVSPAFQSQKVDTVECGIKYYM